jgi:addiction module RelB/DinJ family antitoxin
MMQMRVSPEIRLASENVLQRLGLNLTEAMEMFLRRLVIDQRIPFDVVAIDNTAYTKLLLDWEEQSRTIEFQRDRRLKKTSKARRRPKRE